MHHPFCAVFSISTSVPGFNSSCKCFLEVYYIFDYITKGVGLDKPEKLSLRKRTKNFVVQEAHLYYIGGGEERISHSKSSEQGYSLSGYTINDNEIQFLPTKFHVVIHIL